MKASNMNASGKFSENLYPKISRFNQDSVTVGLYSTPYAKYVDGISNSGDIFKYVGGHDISPGAYSSFVSRGKGSSSQYENSGVISKISEWLNQKGIIFHNKQGDPMTDKQTSFAIIKSWNKRGRKGRFFINTIINQHLATLESKLSNIKGE